jgi:hypothetical protein
MLGSGELRRGKQFMAPGGLLFARLFSPNFRFIDCCPRNWIGQLGYGKHTFSNAVKYFMEII